MPNIKQIADSEKQGLRNPAQVAERLGVTPAWIYGRHHAGTLPFPAIKVGKNLRFRAEDIETFIEEQINNQQRPYIKAVK